MGSLAELAHRASEFNFKQVDDHGNDALRVAIIHSRHEVMLWLLQHIECYRHISDERRVELILFAVANHSYSCLSTFTASTEKGGLGWSLDDVCDQHGRTPMKVAVAAKSREMVLQLVLPKDQGGYGINIDEESLRQLEEDTYHCTPEANHAKYIRQQLTRSPSFFDWSDAGAVDTDKYYPVREFSKRTHCKVRLFAQNDESQKRFIVKTSRQQTPAEHAGWMILDAAERKSREAMFANLLYPAEGPNWVAHFVDSDTHSYDSRTILSYVEGDHPDAVSKRLSSPVEVAHMLLAITLEMNRIHNLQVVHRDVRVSNIIVRKLNAAVRSARDFSVHFIDVEYAAYAGQQIMTYMQTENDIHYLAPETLSAVSRAFVADYSQDIFSLAYAMQQIVYATEPNFTSIQSFIDLALSSDPAKRPSLINFISELEREIEEVTQTQTKKRNLSLGC